MKNIRKIVLLIALILLLGLLGGIGAMAEEDTAFAGEFDFDADAAFTSADATVLLRYIDGWRDSTMTDEIGDVNLDGKTGIYDAVCLLKLMNQPDTLKIVAFNLRCANDGGEKNISKRAPKFKALMNEVQPDIMGLSEATPTWINYLNKKVLGSKYTMLYTYRAESSQEAQPLLFDKLKYTLLEDGYFWLSETPDVSSIGWGGKYYRGVTWAKLKVRATGKIFLYYSTHMTSTDEAVIGSAKLIYDHALEHGGFTDYSVFLSGDFNIEPWSDGYNELVKNFVDVNDYLGFDPSITYNAYKNDGSGKLIDYVMCSPDNVVPTYYEVLSNFPETGGYISDHKGLYVEATLK